MAKVPENTPEESPEKTGLNTPRNNAIAIIIVLLLGIYVFMSDSKPKGPIDRSVDIKTLSSKTLGNTLQTTQERENITEKQSQGTSSGMNVGENKENDEGNLPEAPSVVVSGSATLLRDAEKEKKEQNGEGFLGASEIGATEREMIGTDEKDSGVGGIYGEGATSEKIPTAEFFSSYSGSDTVYYNTALDYGFLLPKGAYYQGFGAQDGASHSIGIATGTGVTSWTGATVRLWYFKNSLPTELNQTSGNFYQDPSENTTYLRLGSGAVKIEGLPDDTVVQKIIQSLRAGK